MYYKISVHVVQDIDNTHLKKFKKSSGAKLFMSLSICKVKNEFIKS